MVLPYYKVSKLDNGKWAITIAKGKKAGTIIEIFNSSDEAWNAYNNIYNSNVKV